MAWLPQGFVIDKQPATQGNLPAGFVVDQPAVSQRIPWQWLQNVTENYMKPVAQFIGWWVQWFSNVWWKIEKTLDTANDWLNRKLFGRQTSFVADAAARDAKLKANMWNRLFGMDTTSKSFQRWETVWDIIGKSTLLPWSAWWKTFLGRLVKNAPIWALKTQAGTLLTEQRFATPTETAIWAWAEWLAAWLFGKATKSQYENLVKPKMTVWEEADRAAQWLKKSNIFWKVKILANKAEKKMAKVADEIWLKPWKNNVNNINKAILEEAKESDNLINIAKQKPTPIPTKEVSSELNKIQPPLSIRSDKALLGKFNDIKKTFIDMYNKSSKKTTVWLLETRKSFYKLIQKEFPNLWTSDAETPTRIVIRAIQDVSKNILNKKVWWQAVKNSLDKQASIMGIIENLATKAEKWWTSGISRFFNNTSAGKILKKVWWTALSLGAWALWYKILQWKWSWWSDY